MVVINKRSHLTEFHNNKALGPYHATGTYIDNHRCLSHGACSPVQILVFDQSGFPCEAFPALKTGKWLFSCVSLFVAGQVSLLREAFAAHGAGIRLIPRVNDFMTVQAGFTQKVFSAIRARVWLVSGVIVKVVKKVVLEGEMLAAVRIGMRCLSHVSLLVGEERSYLSEEHATGGAWELLRCPMDCVKCYGGGGITGAPFMSRGIQEICTVR